jgi:hypothetical protein
MQPTLASSAAAPVMRIALEAGQAQYNDVMMMHMLLTNLSKV